MIDLDAMTTPDLEALRDDVARVLSARYAVQTAPARAQAVAEQRDAELDQIAQSWHAAHGGPGTTDQPVAWKRPGGAHDVYPDGAVVTHGGKTYRSLIPRNAATPGDESDPQHYRWWQVLDPETGEPPEPETDPTTGLVLWSGLGVAYVVGDERAHLGLGYVCRQAHTSQPAWMPVVTPALWERKAAPAPPTPAPPTVLAWAAGQVVVVGDERTHDGRLWRAKLAHTTHAGWAPSAHTHAVWTDIGAAPTTHTGRQP